MPVQNTDAGEGFATVGVDARDMERYADITLENGEVLVYDQEDEEAWIQADFAVGVETMV